MYVILFSLFSISNLTAYVLASLTCHILPGSLPITLLYIFHSCYYHCCIWNCSKFKYSHLGGCKLTRTSSQITNHYFSFYRCASLYLALTTENGLCSTSNFSLITYAFTTLPHDVVRHYLGYFLT